MSVCRTFCLKNQSRPLHLRKLLRYPDLLLIIILPNLKTLPWFSRVTSIVCSLSFFFVNPDLKPGCCNIVLLSYFVNKPTKPVQNSALGCPPTPFDRLNLNATDSFPYQPFSPVDETKRVVGSLLGCVPKHRFVSNSKRATPCEALHQAQFLYTHIR
jgi:hypothetical protein